MEFFAANIHLKEVLVQLIAFVIVFLALKQAAWKPVLTMLKTRREKIESEFAKISETRKELEMLEAEYKKKLSHIEEEARAKLEVAIQEGKKISRELQETARTQARDILEKSKSDIELEAQKARATLRKDIANLVVQATERLVKEKLGSAKDEQMISEFIKELQESKGPLIQP